MIRRFSVIVVLILVSVIPSQSATLLSQLITMLRARAGVSADTTVAFTNTDAMGWINQAQDKVVTLGNYIPKQVDVYVNARDSLGEALPVDYRVADICVMRQSNKLVMLANNPGFAGETTNPQYFVKWKNADTAYIYTKNVASENPYDSTLVRLFYRGSASWFTALSDTCEVQQDRQVHIIEEAYAIYLESERLFQEGFSLQALNRQDMGIVQEKKQ